MGTIVTEMPQPQFFFHVNLCYLDCVKKMNVRNARYLINFSLKIEQNSIATWTMKQGVS